MSGVVYHTGQVVVDLTLKIEALPAPGGDIFADEAGMAVGGGYNVLYAARQLGVRTVYAGMLGVGPFSDAAREGLAQIGVEHVGRTGECDLGYCVALTDATAERTFVSTRGAETMEDPDAFDDLPLTREDVLYISGYSLAHERNLVALKNLVARLGREGIAPKAVFDVSPMVEFAPLDALDTIGEMKPLWSVNEREAKILAERYGIGGISGDDEAAYAGLCERLAGRFGAVLLRAGALGAWYCDGGEVQHVPSISVKPIDTNGAGDAHAGVLCAALARGEDTGMALRWANIAGALSTTVSGPATCPNEEEIRSRA
ncbi:kinase [Arcanobacterium haemolyticum]|nr:kinase [Arcanobacterium haemolyticum]